MRPLGYMSQRVQPEILEILGFDGFPAVRHRAPLGLRDHIPDFFVEGIVEISSDVSVFRRGFGPVFGDDHAFSVGLCEHISTPCE